MPAEQYPGSPCVKSTPLPQLDSVVARVGIVHKQACSSALTSDEFLVYAMSPHWLNISREGLDCGVPRGRLLRNRRKL